MIIKALLNLLGLSRRRAGIAEGSEESSSPAPDPIHLSPSQWDQVDRRIAEFTGDPASVHAHALASIARANVLPLLFDRTGFMALRRDGLVVFVPYDDEPGDIEVVREKRLRNIGLFQGAKLHPELSWLIPPRPPDAVECPDCRGTGKVPFPKGSEHLSERVLCYCGSIGWLSDTTNR